MATQLVTCHRCGGSWPHPAFFRATHKKQRHNGKRIRSPTAELETLCVGCDVRSVASDYVARRKAFGTIMRHAKAYHLSTNNFVRQFGWDVQRITADIQHARLGACAYCPAKFTDLPLAKMSFDIIDPHKPPFYNSNVKICCTACNLSKKRLAPEIWSERQATWPKYRNWINGIRDDPTLGLPLFQPQTQ